MAKSTKAPKAAGMSARELALKQSAREDWVFDALVDTLEETPEALSSEYSDDFLCDLLRSRIPDVTPREIVAALVTLGARATALREFMQTAGEPNAERRKERAP